LCGVEVSGVMKTVSELGYSAAANAIRGEENTTVKVKVFRNDQQGGRFFDVVLVRRCFESKSVSGRILEANPSVGVVRISSFDLKTPSQLKRVMADLMEQDVSYFVFDLRNNPGGDLQSIKAVLSYFLQKGDLIMDVIDRQNTVVRSYTAEVVTDQGDCNVAEHEIGMYADLKMAVLCNENTASAAEVFTATMQDYGLAQIVGMNTFGKGIMQSTKKISFGDVVGYVKFTTYAYQTKRGESYHDKGITPDCVVDLSEEAKKQSILLLKQDQDDQLKTAVQLLLADSQ
jgi:carboxyl-terminal processing protease